jgi:hypothetical protein
VSSGSASQDLKERYFRVLCQVCHSHNVLPTSCVALGVVSVEKRALGAFADIYKGQHAGTLVCIKAFRRQAARDMEAIKRVCVLTVSEEDSHIFFTEVLP